MTFDEPNISFFLSLWVTACSAVEILGLSDLEQKDRVYFYGLKNILVGFLSSCLTEKKVHKRLY